jgi:hypothetical protein
MLFAGMPRNRGLDFFPTFVYHEVVAVLRVHLDWKN